MLHVKSFRSWRWASYWRPLCCNLDLTLVSCLMSSCLWQCDDTATFSTQIFSMLFKVWKLKGCNKLRSLLMILDTFNWQLGLCFVRHALRMTWIRTLDRVHWTSVTWGLALLPARWVGCGQEIAPRESALSLQKLMSTLASTAFFWSCAFTCRC